MPPVSSDDENQHDTERRRGRRRRRGVRRGGEGEGREEMKIRCCLITLDALDAAVEGVETHGQISGIFGRWSLF